MEELENVQKVLKDASNIAYDLSTMSTIITSITGRQIKNNEQIIKENEQNTSSINMKTEEVSSTPKSIEKKPNNPVFPFFSKNKVEKEDIKIKEEDLSNVAQKGSPEAFLQLVLKRKSIKITEASKELGVPKEVVEKWAEILNSQGLVKLKYPFFGDPIASV
ncbi:MAG: hypothetical protein OH318_00220 [Candidatus Parvarchaeota archaeon]|nr:hypothetical protein [Candidatus Rehaiarchaeum fermentans]MCW1293416.1 hypothetical protein [Candidatus Rehaiarchaeum fermentans]